MTTKHVAPVMAIRRAALVCLFLGVNIAILCHLNLLHTIPAADQGESASFAATFMLGCHLQHWKVNSKASLERTRRSNAESESEPPRRPKPQKTRELITVFSTACSPSQDWQSQALLYSHQQQNIPGELVRLLACDDPAYALPPHSYHKYRVVRTPDFDKTFPPQERYSPRNRPMSMEYWLNGLSKDDPNPPSGHDVIIMAVDPDMILLHNRVFKDYSKHNLLNMVRPGEGVAASYDLGWGWVQGNEEFSPYWCPFNTTDCQKPIPSQERSGYNPSFGHPQLLTAEDAKRHAKIWTVLTNNMRKHHMGWETEMYSNVIAMHRTNITIGVEDIMLSHPLARNEQPAWEATQWYQSTSATDSTTPFFFVAHYCQTYRLNNFVFSKGLPPMTAIDLRKCSDDLLLPSPDRDAQFTIANLKQNHSFWKAKGGQEDFLVTRARNGWMIDKVYTAIQDAMGAHFEEFCLPKRRNNNTE